MDTRLDAIHHWIQNSLKIQAYSLAPASADASFRRYFRLTTNNQTRIIMDAPPDHEDCRPFIDVTQRLLAAGINVPEIYASDLSKGFLLLKDLGSVMYLDQLNETTVDALYEDAIQSLTTMQTQANKDKLPVYEAALLQREMMLFSEWLLLKHLHITPPSWLQLSFDFLIENALRQPQVFVHRDYHSRNLTVLPVANPGVIDYQDALVGPITYDLVSLLRDCYISWPTQDVEKWLNQYRDKATQVGLLQKEQHAELPRWFDLMGVQRHLKASGIFARLHHRDGKDNYLKDIPRTLNYIIQVAAYYPELKNLEKFLLTEVISKFKDISSLHTKQQTTTTQNKRTTT